MTEIFSDDSLRTFEMLSYIDPEYLVERDRGELVELIMALAGALNSYTDKMIGSREVAEIFNRKKSWIYDAMSRPRTELQKKVAQLAVRQEGGLMFRMSDIAKLRNEMVEGMRCQSLN